MHLVRDMLTTGQFNSMTQTWQPDGSLLVVLTRHGDPHVYKLWVRDLYSKEEHVIREEITPP